MEKILRLSPSKVNDYETCPRLYYFKHVAKINVEATSANLPFGGAIHYAIEQYLLTGANPVDVFEAKWKKANEETPIQFSSQWTQEDLNATGTKLMSLFATQWETWQFQIAYDEKGKPLVEQKYEMTLEHNDIKVDFVGRIDIEVITPTGNIGLLDWKSPAQVSSEVFAKLADQHTAYQMLVENKLGIHIDQVGYAELVKAKIPKKKGIGPHIADIHWVPRRSEEMIREYQLKILKTAQDIQRNYFPRRPAMAYNTPCNLCDYQQACFNN